MPVPVWTPRYVGIYRALKQRIEQGELAPEARLPAQRALSREFGVTVMTLRQAIRLLEQEGLVVTRHGAGTFVSPRHVAYTLSGVTSLAQELAAQGLELTTRVLTAGLEEATPPAALRLELRGTDAYVIERLRLADGEPIALQRSHLPPSLGRRLAGIDLSRRSLYDVLAELGVDVVRASETLHPVVLDGRRAELLATEPGAPAVVSERLTFSTGDRPILYDVAYLPGDRVVITAERLARDVRVTYRLRAASGVASPS